MTRVGISSAALCLLACSGSSPPNPPPPVDAPSLEAEANEPPPASPNTVSAPPIPTAISSVTAASLPSALPLVAPSVARLVCAPDERQHKDSCCRTEHDGGKFTTYCRGPNIGQVCHKTGDSGLMCSCDDPQAPPMQGSSPHGPPDGTAGVVGHCADVLTDGAWYCILDERGLVSHLIAD